MGATTSQARCYSSRYANKVGKLRKLQSPVSTFVYWFDSSGWLGIVGLILTLVGFALTLWNVILSANSAEQARKAAVVATNEVKKLRVITDLSTASTELEEIKRYARLGSWAELPERLSRVRKLLIGTKTSHPELEDDDHALILDAIVAFSEIEKQLVRNSANTAKNASRVNSSLVDHADSVVKLIATIM